MRTACISSTPSTARDRFIAYSIDSSGDSCYPGTSVLVNKLGIQDQAQLDENETLIVGVKSLQFELSPFPESLDFTAVDSDRMMIATIHAASGVEKTLYNLFDEIITP